MSTSEKDFLEGKYYPTGYRLGGSGTDMTSYSEVGIVAPNGTAANAA